MSKSNGWSVNSFNESVIVVGMATDISPSESAKVSLERRVVSLSVDVIVSWLSFTSNKKLESIASLFLLLIILPAIVVTLKIS